MKGLKILLFMAFLAVTPSFVMAAKEKEIPPVSNKWDDENDPGRSISSVPSLFKDANFVYVYSEKQLDNLTIGIIDMIGNVYHQEVTTVPAGIYYVISIESLPEGQYYLCIYQGSNYAIGLFTVNR